MNDSRHMDRINVETPKRLTDNRNQTGGFNMKKVITGIAAAAAIAIVGGTTAFALGPGHHNISSVPDTTADTTAVTCEYCGTTGHCYTDSDHDGICDHREENDRTCTGDYCRNYTEDCSNTSHHYGAGHCRR